MLLYLVVEVRKNPAGDFNVIYVSHCRSCQSGHLLKANPIASLNLILGRSQE